MSGHSITTLKTSEQNSTVTSNPQASATTKPPALTARLAAESLLEWIEAADGTADAPAFATVQRSPMTRPILAILRYVAMPGLAREAEKPTMNVLREYAELELVKLAEEEDERPRVNNLKKVAQAMDSNKRKLISYAIARNWTHYPWIEVLNTTGGRYNKAEFIIQWNAVDSASTEDANDKQHQIGESNKLQVCEIEYSHTVATKSRKGRFIFPGDADTTPLSGWRWRVFRDGTLALFILALIGLVAGILFGIGAVNSNATNWPKVLISSALMTALFGSYVWHVFNKGFLVRLMHDKIAPAPDGWVANDEYAQVELQRRAGNGRSQWARILKYQSECPCGGRISVVRGTGVLEGRLVGVCSDSPLEHVFSFDRGTRRGRPLLSPYRDRDWSFGESFEG